MGFHLIWFQGRVETSTTIDKDSARTYSLDDLVSP